VPAYFGKRLGGYPASDPHALDRLGVLHVRFA